MKKILLVLTPASVFLQEYNAIHIILVKKNKNNTVRVLRIRMIWNMQYKHDAK